MKRLMVGILAILLLLCLALTVENGTLSKAVRQSQALPAAPAERQGPQGPTAAGALREILRTACDVISAQLGWRPRAIGHTGLRPCTSYDRRCGYRQA